MFKAALTRMASRHISMRWLVAVGFRGIPKLKIILYVTYHLLEDAVRRQNCSYKRRLENDWRGISRVAYRQVVWSTGGRIVILI